MLFRSSMGIFARDAVEIIKREKLKNIILVGHCLGTNICVKVNELLPVSKMILIGLYLPAIVKYKFIFSSLAKLYLFMKPLFRFIKRKLSYQNYSKFRKFPSLLMPLVDLRGTTMEVYSNTMLSLYDYDPDVSLIKTPTLVVEGKKDKLINPLKLRQLLLESNFVLVTIDRQDHLGPIKTPKRAIELIDTFL